MPHTSGPGSVHTLDEFTAALRSLKVDAGNPSITTITRRIHRTWQQAGRPRNEWPARSTVGNCFQVGRRRPNVDLVMAVVETLVDGDVAVVTSWRHALLSVLGEASSASCLSVSDRLPADLPEFTGRTALLDQATRLFEGDGRRAVVFDGMAGIGKTTLAVHLAHRLRRRGQAGEPVLAVDLHGMDPNGPPAAPEEVLDSFLRLLGVPGDRIPPSLDARTALYRRTLSGTRALVLLDNAASADQVRPLLPGRDCAALVTSRHKLAGLSDIRNLPVGAFTPEEARQLLRSTARGRHVDADARTAAEIVDLLGRHPLALSIIGGHLHDHLNWTLTDYLEPLTALAMEGGLRAALALSDRGLPPEPQRLLRLLALHPGHDFDTHAAAALANQTLTTTQRQIDTLLSAHLMEPRGAGRYGFHDLVRAYATERAAVEEPMSRSRQALARLLDHYRYTAAAATALVSPHVRRPRALRPTTPVMTFADARQARGWLIAERANLFAVEVLEEPPAVPRPRVSAALVRA